MKKSICFLFAICFAVISYADSPLTSIFFAEAYSDIPFIAEIIAERQQKEVYNFSLNERYLKFLDDESISLDKKIALINALGWGESKNIDVMRNHICEKYRIQQDVLDSIMVIPADETLPFYSPAEVISSNDLTMLAYIQIMHDYFNPLKGFQSSYHAVVSRPESEATAYVLGLLLAQMYMDFDWCSVYTIMVTARDADMYTSDRLRPEAIAIIFEYIGLYEESCNVAGEEGGEMNEDDLYLGQFTSEYWKEHPVYTAPASPQISDKGNKVDLVLETERSDNNPAYSNWIIYDDETSGTLVKVKILNKGNVASIETNLELDVREMIEGSFITSMVIQANLPSIPPGQTITVDVKIPGYWIYDPDADFIIQLDKDNNILESDENNNMKEYHEFG